MPGDRLAEIELVHLRATADPGPARTLEHLLAGLDVDPTGGG
jgi:hypothetical protein